MNTIPYVMTGLQDFDVGNANGDMARWGGRTWRIMVSQINTLSDLAWTDGWNDDDSVRDPSQATLTCSLYRELMPNVDLSDEIMAWKDSIGAENYLYVGGMLFGTQQKYRLTDVDVSNVQVIGGEIVRCDIEATFTESRETAPGPDVKRVAKKTLASSTAEKAKLRLGGNVYRLHDTQGGNHMFTLSTSERDGLKRIGWVYEGVAWVAPKNGTIAVYRLYNPNNGDHVFTVDQSEANSLVEAGWKYEGVAWSSVESGTSVFRLYNPYAGTHMYTASSSEQAALRAAGWRYEGVAFRV